MPFKFTLKSFRKNKVYYFSASFVLCLIILMLTFAFSAKEIVGYAADNVITDISGGSQVSVAVNPVGSDNFFNINDLKKDEYVQENIESMFSYFRTYFNFETKSGSAFCTAVISGYDELTEFSPFIYTDGQVNRIYDNETIISASFATDYNVKIGDKIKFSFGNNTAEYTVKAIAENRGMFGFNPVELSVSPIYISDAGFKKIYLSFLGFTYNSLIVTNSYLKLKDTSDTSGLVSYINGNYAHLVAYDFFLPRIDAPRDVLLPYFNGASVVAAVFCLAALTIILKLLFIKEEKNFELLRRLGYGRGHIIRIQMLVVALLLFIAAATALLFAGLLLAGFSLISYVLIGYTLNFIAFLISVAVTAGITGAALLFALNTKAKNDGKIMHIKTMTLPRLLLADTVKQKSYRFLFVFLIFALSMTFLTISVLTGLTTRAEQIKNSKANLFAITTSETTLKILQESGDVYEAAVLVSRQAEANGHEFFTQIIAIGPEGYKFLTEDDAVLGKGECAISGYYARRYGLDIGNTLTLTVRGGNQIYVISTITNDKLLMGLNVMINIEHYEGTDYRGYLAVVSDKAQVIEAIAREKDYVLDFDILINNLYVYCELFLGVITSFAVFNVIGAFIAIILACMFLAGSRKETGRLLNKIGISERRFAALQGMNTVVYSVLATIVSVLVTFITIILLGQIQFLTGGEIIFGFSPVWHILSAVVYIGAVFVFVYGMLRKT